MPFGFNITRDNESEVQRVARLLEEAQMGEPQLITFAETPATTTDPRKVSKGTSYNAKGLVEVESGAYVEQGSSQAVKYRDPVPALGNRRSAIQVYDRMTTNDAAVDVSLRAAKIPVQGATYFMQPFDESDEAQEIAEFCEFNLLKGMNQPFLLVLDDILRMYEYGSSILEPVWELREWAPRKAGANRRRYTMLRKLGVRPASTIQKFEYDDNGGPVGIVQNAIRADGKVDEVKIPIEKLIIFTFNKQGGDLEGKSLLRTAYKHWYMIDILERIDGIQKERHGIGIPKVKLNYGFTDGDVTAAWKLVTQLRTNEKAGIVEPPNMEITFVKPEGELVDVIKSIEHHKGMIMLNVMVQFLLLGLTGGGGRATSSSHQNIFEKSLKYVANLICEYFNLFLIPRLVGYNFDTQKFPRLSVRNVGEGRETQQWASALANLAAQNYITLDLPTEQWVREQMDAPLKLGKEQTPEANASSANDFGKGDVQTGDPGSNEGNSPKGVDID